MKTSRKIKVILFVFCAWAQYSTIQAQTTRGIGIYPGAAEEFFGPQLVAGDGYRNLARGRMVYQSSSFDFNMTAQLLTDGIVERGARNEEREKICSKLLPPSSNIGATFVEPWLKIVADIRPQSVMIYTIDRETPIKGLEKASPDELNRIRDLVIAEGIPCTASY